MNETETLMEKEVDGLTERERAVNSQLIYILWDLLKFGYDHIEVRGNDVIAIPLNKDKEYFSLNCPSELLDALRAYELYGKHNIEDVLHTLRSVTKEEDYFLDMRLFRHKPTVLEGYQAEGIVYLLTLNGIVQTNPGDWIIIGVNGEQYPCDPEIFKKLYDIIL